MCCKIINLSENKIKWICLRKENVCRHKGKSNECFVSANILISKDNCPYKKINL